MISAELKEKQKQEDQKKFFIVVLVCSLIIAIVCAIFFPLKSCSNHVNNDKITITDITEGYNKDKTNYYATEAGEKSLRAFYEDDKTKPTESFEWTTNADEKIPTISSHFTFSDMGIEEGLIDEDGNEINNFRFEWDNGINITGNYSFDIFCNDIDEDTQEVLTYAQYTFTFTISPFGEITISGQTNVTAKVGVSKAWEYTSNVSGSTFAIDTTASDTLPSYITLNEAIGELAVSDLSDQLATYNIYIYAVKSFHTSNTLHVVLEIVGNDFTITTSTGNTDIVATKNSAGSETITVNASTVDQINVTAIDCTLPTELTIPTVLASGELVITWTPITTVATYNFEIEFVKNGYNTVTIQFTFYVLESTSRSYLITTSDVTYYINTNKKSYAPDQGTIVPGIFFYDRYDTNNTNYRFYDDDTDQLVTTVNRDTIKSLVINTIPQDMTNAPNDFLFRFCSEMRYLTNIYINFPPNLVSVGNQFCSEMFKNCISLSSTPQSFYLPSTVTNVGTSFCRNMFQYCDNLKFISNEFILPPITGDVPESFCASMFYGCKKIKNLPDNFNLPQGITTNTGNSPVGLFSGMFCACEELLTLPDNFNLPQNLVSVSQTAFNDMFYGCKKLNNLPDNFNFPQTITTSGVRFAGRMFYNCFELTHLPNNFNLPVNLVNSNNTESDSSSYNFYQLFCGCKKLTSLPSGFNFPQGMTDYCTPYFAFSMFDQCEELTSLPTGFKFPDFNAPAPFVSTGYARSTFAGCKKLTSLPTGFTIPDVGSMREWPLTATFSGCEALVSLPTGFNIPNASELSGDNYAGDMFQNCKKLASLPTGFNFPQTSTISPEMAGFASRMFSGCEDLASLPSGFTLPQNMLNAGGGFCREMFKNCKKLTSLNNFSIPNVTIISGSFCETMFSGCEELVSLPTGFNLPQTITSISSLELNNFAMGMFSNCKKLASLPTGFNVLLPTSIVIGNNFCSGMFEGCIDLTTISASFSIPNFTNWTFNSGDGPNNFCYRMFKSSGIVIGGPSSVAFTMPSTMPTGTNAQNSWGFEIFPGIVSTACAAGQSIQIPRG